MSGITFTTSAVNNSYSITKVPAQHLPNVVVNLVLRHLEPSELAICCRLNKQWKTLASNNDLWKRLLPYLQDNSEGLSIQQYINKHGARSKEMVEKRLKDFAANAPWNQKLEFQCKFAYNSGVYFRPEFTFLDYSTPDDHNQIEFGDATLIERCLLFERLPEKRMFYHGEDCGDNEICERVLGENLRCRFVKIYSLPSHTENKKWAKKLNQIVFSVIDERKNETINRQQRIAARPSERNRLLLTAAIILVAVNVILYRLLPDQATPT